MANEADITTEQRANLATLAAYLRALPVDYPDFAMDDYTSEGGSIASAPECGTAACAAGHGPAAGIAPEDDEGWLEYSHRAFGVRGYAWEWCFAGGWSRRDNSAHGAAARIEWLLERGVPSDAFQQRCGQAPLCYSTPVTSA